MELEIPEQHLGWLHRPKSLNWVEGRAWWYVKSRYRAHAVGCNLWKMTPKKRSAQQDDFCASISYAISQLSHCFVLIASMAMMQVMSPTFHVQLRTSVWFDTIFISGSDIDPFICRVRNSIRKLISYNSISQKHSHVTLKMSCRLAISPNCKCAFELWLLPNEEIFGTGIPMKLYQVKIICIYMNHLARFHLSLLKVPCLNCS